MTTTITVIGALKYSPGDLLRIENSCGSEFAIVVSVKPMAIAIRPNHWYWRMYVRIKRLFQ